MQEAAGTGSDEGGWSRGTGLCLTQNRGTATGARGQGRGDRGEGTGTGALQGGAPVFKSCPAEGFSWASDADGSKPQRTGDWQRPVSMER